MYEKVYHPETDEMFEVPQHKAIELRLNHGWRSQPLDLTGIPAVQATESVNEPDDWRIETAPDVTIQRKAKK